MNGQTSPKMLALGQLTAVLFAAVLAYAPQYYWLVLVAYFLLTGLATVRAQRSVAGASADKVLKGKVLFRETDASSIAVDDTELVKEYKEQGKALMYSLLSFFIIVLLFSFLKGHMEKPLVETLQGYGLSRELSLFVFWLILFEVFFGISRLTTYLSTRSSKPMIIVPQKYEVTEHGIVSHGLGGFALEFPLPEGYAVRVDAKRKFVEISDGKTKRLRLYTKNPTRLYALITSLNEKAKKRAREQGPREAH